MRLVLVHMATDGEARDFFARYGLDEVDRISDPERRLYGAFQLERARLGQIFSLRVIGRALKALFSGHGIGKPVGDPRQMPGAFLVHDGRVVEAFRPPTVADAPDYAAFAATDQGAR